MYGANPTIDKAWTFPSSFSWLYASLFRPLSENQRRGTTMGYMGVQAICSLLCSLALLGLIPGVSFSSYKSFLVGLSDLFMTWWVWQAPAHNEYFQMHSHLVPCSGSLISTKAQEYGKNCFSKTVILCYRCQRTMLSFSQWNLSWVPESIFSYSWHPNTTGLLQYPFLLQAQHKTSSLLCHRRNALFAEPKEACQVLCFHICDGGCKRQWLVLHF